MKWIFVFVSLTLMTGAHAARSSIDTLATTMVPKGKLFAKDGRDYEVKTRAGTKIELEFERNGSLQEASGANLNRGDDLEPGQGLISLSTAAQNVAKLGHKVRGDWNLEKDNTYGWVYELEGEIKGEEMTYLVNAKNGNLIKAED